MDAWTGMMANAEFAVALGMLLFLSAIVYMLVEAAMGQLHERRIELADDESMVRELEVGTAGSSVVKRRLTLTNKRFLAQSYRWWMLATVSQYIDLREVDGVEAKRQLSGVWLLLGFFLWTIIPPLGILVFTSALVQPVVYLVLGRYRTGRGLLASVASYHSGSTPEAFRRAVVMARDIQRQKARIDGRMGFVDVEEPVVAVDDDSAYRPLMLGLVAMAVLAVAQRWLQEGISVESSIFLFLYCAVPIIVGYIHGRKAGLLAGFMGMMMLFAVTSPLPAGAGAEEELVTFPRALLSLGVMATMGYMAGRSEMKGHTWWMGGLAFLWWFVAWATDAPCTMTVTFISHLAMTAGMIVLLMEFLRSNVRAPGA
ncbi:MAG: hypothetical protein ACON4N_03120 [Myxococcota bacterium]